MSSGGEIVHLAAGQCGVGMGAAVYRQLCLEHNIDSHTGTLLLEWDSGIAPALPPPGGLNECRCHTSQPHVHFHEARVPARLPRLPHVFNAASQEHTRYVPRAVFFDLDTGPLHHLTSSDMGTLFDSSGSFVASPHGSGSTYAKGYYTAGRELIDSITDRIRYEVERCGCLQGFQLTHALAGGTGSGLGALVLAQLKDEYPSTMVTTYSALPALDVEPVSVIQPYNTVLGLASLLASADLSVLVSHGQGVGQGVGVGMNRSHSGSHDRRHYSTPPPTSFAAGLRSSRLATATASVTATTAATAALSLASTFTAENRAAASVICDVTSTMRFNDGNSSRWSMRKLTTNLVPLNGLIFVQPFQVLQSPLLTTLGSGGTNYLPTDAQSLVQRISQAAGMRSRSATVPSARIPMPRASNSTSAGASAILCVAGIYRAADASALELERYMRSAHRGTPCAWADPVLPLVCRTPPPAALSSLTMLVNGSQAAASLQANLQSCRPLFHRKAFLHWFTHEGMAGEELQHAATVLEDVVHQYQRYEAGTGTGTDPARRAEVLDASEEEEEEEHMWVSPDGDGDTEYWEQKGEEGEEERVRGDRERVYWERKEEQKDEQKEDETREQKRASSHRRAFMDSSEFYKAFE